MVACPADTPSASFAEFDRKAQAGQPLTVVFFGGSLTWGANASEPNLTSYRGLMGQYLRDKYPKSSFAFYDAAIGGTGSKLGMFRLDRDVLSRHPDLVFYDFTANDGYDGSDPKSLASYEGILRDMINKGIPVVQAYFGFKFQFGPDYHPDQWHGYLDRLKLADAYHTGVGDTFPYIQDKITSGQADINILWGINHGKDGAHPDDPGYQLFFEAVRDGFEKAIKDNLVCAVPDKPVFSDDYHTRARQILVDGTLPAGWTREKTFRTSVWYDGLSSRWMGDVAVCDVKDKATVQPLKVDFTGTFVGLFGEMDENGLSFKALVDGKLVPCQPNPKVPATDIWPVNGKAFHGRIFFWRPISDSLPPGKHTLEIDPVFPDKAPPAEPGKPPGPLAGQLRIESVCSAGD
jgi:lysophospholipase L1-like esterase